MDQHITLCSVFVRQRGQSGQHTLGGAAIAKERRLFPTAKTYRIRQCLEELLFARAPFLSHHTRRCLLGSVLEA